jgi:hypothetical protein
MNNFPDPKDDHFYVFVTFGRKMAMPSQTPDVFVLASKEIPKLLYQNPKKSRLVIQMSKVRTAAAQ